MDQNSTAGVTKVLVFVPTYQDAVLGTVFCGHSRMRSFVGGS